MNRRHAFGGYAHPFLHWIVLLLVIAGIAALVTYLIIRLTRRPAAPSPGAVPPPPTFRPPGLDQAVEQARMRYARGEMSRDDYLQVVSDLTGVAPPPPTPAPTPPDPTAPPTP